jgi:hypothetical protein
MRVFGSLLGAAVVAGAGLVYYVHQRHQRLGVGYLDVIKQLPGEVQRAGGEARKRATEALEQGKSAARRREADLVRQLKAAGSSATDEAAVTSAADPAADAPPAFEPEPTAV